MKMSDRFKRTVDNIIALLCYLCIFCGGVVAIAALLVWLTSGWRMQG